jgi:hypothetical protein
MKRHGCHGNTTIVPVHLYIENDYSALFTGNDYSSLFTGNDYSALF